MSEEEKLARRVDKGKSKAVVESDTESVVEVAKSPVLKFRGRHAQKYGGENPCG